MNLTFIIDQKKFEILNRGHKPREGWSNSATWQFNLLFFNRKENYLDFVDLVRSNEENKYLAAYELLTNAYKAGKMSALEDWVEGPINVIEIYDTFAAEVKGAAGT